MGSYFYKHLTSFLTFSQLEGVVSLAGSTCKEGAGSPKEEGHMRFSEARCFAPNIFTRILLPLGT